MAEGIRIVHSDPNLRGKIIVIPTFRKYSQPILCNMCKKAHTTKHYHLKLDGEGAAIVSQKILQELTKINMAGFKIDSVVKDPPAQTAGFNAPKPSPKQLQEMKHALDGIAPPGAKIRIQRGK